MNKVKNYIVNNKIFIVFFIVILIVMNVSVINTSYTLGNTDMNKFMTEKIWITLLITNIFSISLFVLIGYISNKKMPIEKIFLTLFIPLGIAYLLANPIRKSSR